MNKEFVYGILATLAVMVLFYLAKEIYHAIKNKVEEEDQTTKRIREILLNTELMVDDIEDIKKCLYKKRK